MRPDYSNLNWFDTATVGMIVLGLALVGSVFFSSLSTRQQDHVIAALNVLDMHEQVPQELEVMHFIAFEVPQNYLDVFYKAFVQVASIPQENLPDLSVVPKGIKLAYDSALDHQISRSGQAGQVLGASIISECNPPAAESGYNFSIPQINLAQFTKVDIDFQYYKR